VPLFRLIVLARPLHWVKNLVVLAPLLFAGLLLDRFSALAAGATAAAFCLLASGVYLANDLHDRRVDRLHPAKRTRPLAAGELATGPVAAVSALLLAAGLVLAWWVERRAPPLHAAGLGAVGALGWCVIYVALNALYTGLLKRIMLLDLLALASGFAIRAFAGAAALQLVPSRWLVICCFCLAFYLAAGKRHLEQAQLGDAAAEARPMLAPYGPRTLDRLLVLGGLLAIGSYVLYTISPETVDKVGSRGLVASIPMVIFCVWLYGRRVRAGRGGDPVVMLALDPAFLAAAAAWGAAVVYVLYWPLL
jgi:4-hydroxybenzoate polyprenyltransferase